MIRAVQPKHVARGGREVATFAHSFQMSQLGETVGE